MPEREIRLESLPWEIRRVIAIALWNLLLCLLRLEYSENSEKNLQKANELLKEHSIVLYVNHTTMLPDALLGLSMTLSGLTNAEHIFAPVKDKYYSPLGKNMRFTDRMVSVLLQFVKPLGATLFPIHTKTQTDSDSTQDLTEEQKTNKAFIAEMNEKLVKAGSVLGIAPEGTRAKDGRLKLAKNGIGYFEQSDPNGNIYYLPVGIVLNKFGKPKVEIGAPITLSELLRQNNLEMKNLSIDKKERAAFITNLLMQQLVELLPEEMHGVYAQDHKQN